MLIEDISEIRLYNIKRERKLEKKWANKLKCHTLDIPKPKHSMRLSTEKIIFSFTFEEIHTKLHLHNPYTEIQYKEINTETVPQFPQNILVKDPPPALFSPSPQAHCLRRKGPLVSCPIRFQLPKDFNFLRFFLNLKNFFNF